jgi:pSer/pThr/pTyr-binding forkhead associated (FHA) protein
MQPRLLAISGSLTGTVRPLIDGQISIGRDESNQLCLIDTVVSSKHCTIKQVGEQYEVVDLASRNGTFVNGIPVNRKAIEHGDTIRVGKSELLFLMHEGETATTSQIRLTDMASVSTLRTIGVEHPAALPTFGVEVGRMARDLAALFRINNIINSIREEVKEAIQPGRSA